jgi:hypothetical protein
MEELRNQYFSPNIFMVSNQEEWVGQAMYQTRRDYKCYPTSIVGKSKTQEHIGDLGVDEKLILKRHLRKLMSGLIRLRQTVP